VKVMNVGDSDRVSAIARVTSRKKKKTAVPEGQQALIDEPVSQMLGLTDLEQEAEELVSEEFEEDQG